MPISATYDKEADALYIRLREGDRARTIEIDEAHYVDVDEQGAALGIEILYPTTGSRIGEILERFGLAGQLEEVARVVGEAAPAVTATYAGNASHAYAVVVAAGQPGASGVTGWPSSSGNAVPQIPEPA